MTSTDDTTSEGVSTHIKSKIRAKRGLVYNIGISDSLTPITANGKHVRAYSVWRGVLRRCYSVNFQKKRPNYEGCSVVEEWHSFANFEKWFTENYVEGYDLDKDLLVPGNCVYGPETCVFVAPAINSLLQDKRATCGEFPLGVCFRKDLQKYTAQINTKTGRKRLGHFTTPLEAHRAYQLAKADVIAAAEINNPRVRVALDLRIVQLRDDHLHGRITVKL